MKVFISWSGKRSKAVGEFLDSWLRCVIQAVRPWISSRDIDRGALWFSEINDQLKDTSIGIVCLTKSNINSPWVLFESGALAKGLSSNRVCTFLIDLLPTDIQDPLAQFNHTLPNKEGLWNLVMTLNSLLVDNKLPENLLENIFNTYWQQFENGFSKILNETEDSSVPKIVRDKDDILLELLTVTRSLEKRVRSMEIGSDYNNSLYLQNKNSNTINDFDDNISNDILNFMQNNKYVNRNEALKFLTMKYNVPIKTASEILDCYFKKDRKTADYDDDGKAVS